MSLTIRPPPGRASGDEFRKPAVPSRFNGGGSGLKRAFSARGDGDSSDDDEDADSRAELVTSFDQNAPRRCVCVSNLRSKRFRQLTQSMTCVLCSLEAKEEPLVIAALPNRDWRAVANARRTMIQQNGPSVGADGSVGGLGTHDRMGDGPQLSGLIVKNEPHEDSMPLPATNGVGSSSQPIGSALSARVEDEDERARRSILESLSGTANDDANQIDAIASSGNNDWMLTRTPQDESEAYRLDVLTRPDSATVDDYSRVPIEHFGAAMLRGMGWSSNAAHDVQPYIPPTRPALLGIGAKERPPDEIPGGAAVGIKKKHKPDMKYMPLVKKEVRFADSVSGMYGSPSCAAQREAAGRDSGSSSRASSSSRGPSRSSSPSRRREHDDDRHDSDRKRDHDSNRDRDSDRRRDHEYDSRDRRERDDRRREDRDGDRGYDRDRRRDRDREPKSDDRSERRKDERSERDREYGRRRD
ncbi:DExH-box splicing factor binding site-domain-containing protein [Auriculariales sp. MPI-PUGE-AT-0066]|nr:DExH-box splicing factor binding site-domain-containing protein [Auriculariales sp. MPI-PUGE-AT-0066]